MAGNTSNTFLAAMNQGLNLAHTAENDKRLEQQAAIMNQMHQMQMLKLAQEFAFDTEVQNNPELRKAVSSQFQDPPAAEKAFSSGIKFYQAKTVLPLKDIKESSTTHVVQDASSPTGWSHRTLDGRTMPGAAPPSGQMERLKPAGYSQGRLVVNDSITGKQFYQDKMEPYNGGQLQPITAPAPIYNIIQTGQGYIPVNARTGQPSSGPLQVPGTGEALQKPTPEGQIEKATGIGTLRQMASDLNDSLASGADKYVGPVAGRLGQFEEKWRDLPPDQVKFYATTRDMGDMLLRARSGAQINEQEYQRLLKLVPDATLPAANYKARLDRFTNMLDTIAQQRSQNLGAAGYTETPSQSTQKGKILDKVTASAILKEAGGNKDQAREIARQRGYKWPTSSTK